MKPEDLQIADVLHRTTETLETARQGYKDLVDSDRSRRMTGLRNLIVFGRSVTFVLQNLRSALPAGVFDEWYAPHQADLKADPLMRYFVEARNELEKQGKLSVHLSVNITNFSSEEMNKFQRPAGATHFFIGDQLGGSGWMVNLPDGSSLKYYVELPSSVGVVNQQFSALEASANKELHGLSVDEISRRYLERLDRLILDAKTRFLGRQPEGSPPKRTHLRLVK